MSLVRRMCRVKWQSRETNKSILQRCGVHSIANCLSYRRLRWLGHLARMSDERMPKKLLFGVLEGTAPRGRPSKQWHDNVRSDLKKLNICYSWYNLAKSDRIEWRKRIRTFLDTPGPEAGNV